jgi:hypothetical protein
MLAVAVEVQILLLLEQAVLVAVALVELIVE